MGYELAEEILLFLDLNKNISNSRSCKLPYRLGEVPVQKNLKDFKETQTG